MNPILQNYAHITALTEILKEHYSGLYYSVIAFSNKATFKDVEIHSDYVEVVYLSKLIKTIKLKKQVEISLRIANELTQHVTNANLVGKENRKLHVKEIQGKMKGKRELINNGTCPRCNGQLINQNGKLGTFKGCNNYPKCLFVLK